jgi:hypothetical protein
VWTAQAFELAALKQGNLASSGLGGMAGWGGSSHTLPLHSIAVDCIGLHKNVYNQYIKR